MATKTTKTTVAECNVPECGKPGRAGRGLCGKHYYWGKSSNPKKRAVYHEYQVVKRAASTKEGQSAADGKAEPADQVDGVDDVDGDVDSDLSPAGGKLTSNRQPQAANVVEPLPIEAEHAAAADLAIACCTELASRLGAAYSPFRGGVLFDTPTETDLEEAVWLSGEGEFRTIRMVIGEKINRRT